MPATVTIGFCSSDVKLFGPVQLNVTSEVEEEPERVAEEPLLQLSVPTADAQAFGGVLFNEIRAVSLAVQPVAQSVTVRV